MLHSTILLGENCVPPLPALVNPFRLHDPDIVLVKSVYSLPDITMTRRQNQGPWYLSS